MRKYILALFVIATTISLSSCSDWLDVPPVGQNTDKEQYSTERNINDVLNGIYIGMASTELYGGRMTMSTIEQLAHYYYAPSSTINQADYQLFYDIQTYNYTESSVKKTFSPIWSKAYFLIAQTNKFIENVKDTEVLTTEKRDVLLGEAYAIRAFIHFDLLRLFGNIYDESDQQKRLPYKMRITDPSKNETEQLLTSKEFVEKVLADINVAEEYLKNDPILKYGIMNPNDDSTPVTSNDIFARYLRSKRLNLIAVKALKARILMYIGQQNEAAKEAQAIIDMPDMIENIDGSNENAKFKWVVFNNINAGDKSDMVFSTEVLFGIENSDLYPRWKSYTESTQKGKAYVMNLQNLLKNILNTTEDSPHLVSDVRAKFQWTVSSSLGSDLYRSIKFTEFSETKGRLSYNLQPLMRITELYYIIIENDIQSGRTNDAIKLLNSVLRRRGYKSNEEIKLNTSASALKDILKQEYYREFFAEGQTFFYLKRTKSTSIYKSYSAGSMNMNLTNYVVPIPDDEINN